MKTKQNHEVMRELRKGAGFTVTEAAFHMGISGQYLQMLESGMRVIGDSVIAKSARLYGVTFESIKERLNGKAVQS